METKTPTIINVTLLEPQFKHATIFSHFNALEEGETLTIHNDHDPKPLYYQLQSQHGNIFMWEYLEKGPQWWKINITKRITGENQETLGNLAAQDIRKLELFKKYGLNYYENGKLTVEQTCQEAGIDSTVVAQELIEIEKMPPARQLPYLDWKLDFLCDFIVNTHHRYVRKNLPEISAYAQKVMEVHQDAHPELIQINNLVQAVQTDLMAHMEKEEQRLFPLVKVLVEKCKETGADKPISSKDFQNFIIAHEAEHASVGNEMDVIRQLTTDYTLPEDACASYTLLYQMLEAFEDDLHEHIHLENNILFPKAMDLENQLL